MVLEKEKGILIEKANIIDYLFSINSISNSF